MILHDLAALLDRALDDNPAHLLIRLTDEGAEGALGVRFLGTDDPLDHLLGFTAPSDWMALGLRCTGRAWSEAPGSPEAPGTGAVEPVPAFVTTLVGRDGQAAGLLRTGSLVTPLAGLPEGVVGDACRRTFGLPTGPPPPTTVDLWLRIWLDRLIDTVAVLGCADRFADWSGTAALHPANGLVPVRSDGPAALAAATVRLAEAWPWSRLRAEPEVLDCGAVPPDRALCRWMDDGMFARWVQRDMAQLGELALAIDHLLPDNTVTAVADTIQAAGVAVTWPIASQRAAT